MLYTYILLLTDARQAQAFGFKVPLPYIPPPLIHIAEQTTFLFSGDFHFLVVIVRPKELIIFVCESLHNSQENSSFLVTRKIFISRSGEKSVCSGNCSNGIPLAMVFLFWCALSSCESPLIAVLRYTV